jgi:hypothetical protein
VLVARWTRVTGFDPRQQQQEFVVPDDQTVAFLEPELKANLRAVKAIENALVMRQELTQPSPDIPHPCCESSGWATG